MKKKFMSGSFGRIFKINFKIILKNVVVNWYGEITLKILEEKPIKSIKIKAHLDISIMYPLDTKNLTQKKIISKELLKIRFNFYPLKVHNHHLVKISHLIL
jgi:hypothetical protein